MKNPWLENPPTPRGDLGQLDHSLMEELLTFCDFHSIISVGKTCHCLKERADGDLDKCANLAFETRELNRSPNFDSLSKEAKARMKDVIVDCFIIENTQESGIESLIRYGWTNNHESKTNLTQAALQQCRKCIEYSDNDGLDTIYEEFRALSLLNKNITGGFADFSHFAVNPEDKHNDDIGWKVGIHHDDNMSRSDVAEMIRDWSYNYENKHNCNDVGSDYISSSEVDQERLMHFAFCLLRKADPTTLLFTKLVIYLRKLIL